MIWRRIALLALAMLTAVGILCWRFLTDPRIAFLSPNDRATWIVFPSGIGTVAHQAVSLDATFRSEIALDRPPASAQLRIRAARRFELKINGTPVPVSDVSNWKRTTAVGVASYLRSGLNSIEVRVFNDAGPPALCLLLSAGKTTLLETSRDWDASFAGSAWRKAILASDERFPGPGSPASGSENTFGSARNVWPAWILFAVLATGALLASEAWLRKWQLRHAGASDSSGIVLLGATSLVWLLLFFHNNAALPLAEGFDCWDHLNYIKYIREHWSLPSPSQGFEMFQPPLYYFCSAVALSSLHLADGATSTTFVLRFLTMLCGIASFVFVFLTVRKLCPGRVEARVVAVVLAGFLPMNIYLCHFVTNETLQAALIAAAIYASVQLLQCPDPSWKELALAGTLVGAALLTKETAVLLVPALALGILIKLLRAHSSVKQWARFLLLPFGICFVIAGWYYLSLAHKFGTPFLGNWEKVSGFSWWQDPGYRTIADYTRFGRSLVHPFFGAFGGFADGIYSTAWGDGLCSGKGALIFRLPWNYIFMTAGYLLAVIPTVLIGVGVAVSTWHWIKRGSPELAMLLSYSMLTILAFLFMTARVPTYGTTKAFYGLSLIVPLGYFGAIGWIALTGRIRLTRFFVGVALAVWATNTVVSLWIPDSSARYVYLAGALPGNRRADALTALDHALAINPKNGTAWLLKAGMKAESGAFSVADEANRLAMNLLPNAAFAHVQNALMLQQQNRLDEAITEAQNALSVGPEEPHASLVLADCLLRTQRIKEASLAAEVGLTVTPFNADLHHTAALAATADGDLVRSIIQVAYSLMLDPKTYHADSKTISSAILSLSRGPDHRDRLRELASGLPDSPDALGVLAWLLATSPDNTVRNGTLAVPVAERACRLTSDNNIPLLATLAAAYGEAGRFQDAIDQARKAEWIAARRGDSFDRTITAKVLSELQQNRVVRGSR